MRTQLIQQDVIHRRFTVIIARRLNSFSYQHHHHNHHHHHDADNILRHHYNHRRFYCSSTFRLMGSNKQQHPYHYEYFNKPLSLELWNDLQQENTNTQSRLDQTLYNKLFHELITETSSSSSIEVENSPPECGPTGTWEYTVHQNSCTTSDDKPEERRRLLYSRSFQGHTQVVLDRLEESSNENVDILAMSLAVDETLIACLCTTTSSTTAVNHNHGDDHHQGQEVRIRHIQSGKEIIATVPRRNSLVSLELGPILPDGSHSLYLVGTEDQQEGSRPDRVYATTISILEEETSSPSKTRRIVLDVKEPQSIYQSNDPAVMVDVQRTKGCDYVAIQAMTKSSNEIFLSPSGPNSELSLLLPVMTSRQMNLQYHLDVGTNNDVIILVSKDGEEEYKVLETSVKCLPLNPEDYQSFQTEEIQSGEEFVISDMELLRDYLIFYERSTFNGMERIRVHARLDHDASKGSGGFDPTPFILPLPECCKLSPAGNIHFGSHLLRFKLESPFHPGRFYEFDLSNHRFIQIGGTSSTEIKDNDYRTERKFVSSADGTSVPLSLIYQDGLENEQNPRSVVLVGYGAYGEPADLCYNPIWPSLLKRGYVLAFSHSRGGGDLGRSWYLGGCRENKTNAIDDFEACATYLKTRFKGGKLTAFAFSAGGVLVGAVMNRQPSIFDNVVLTNSFLDVFDTLTNPDLYLTSHEWDEYGNPLEDRQAAKRIRSYCPTTNLRPMENCPRTLIIGVLDDENVPYWNAVIFAKTLRDCSKDKESVSLCIEESGGHHFVPDRRLQIAAMQLTFIIQNSY